MNRSNWKFCVDIDIKARDKKAAEQKIGKLLNRKSVLNYKIKEMVWAYNGGTYFCPERIENEEKDAGKN